MQRASNLNTPTVTRVWSKINLKCDDIEEGIYYLTFCNSFNKSVKYGARNYIYAKMKRSSF